MKKVLITGGAGFVGSSLCERYQSEGYHVTAVDNMVTGSIDNVARFIGNGNFDLVERDVSTGLADIKGSFDSVFHFASPASPPAYLKIPIETLLVGSAGTHAALDLAKRDGAVFVLASTSEVYGDPVVHPQKESYWGNVNPNGPRSCYDEAKRYAEAATFAYHRDRGVDIRIVRIFNTFGPHMEMNDGRAVTNFIAQALRNEDITVYGDGSQTRSFCYVTDLVEGIFRLRNSDTTGPVNLGNPAEMTILDLAKTVIEYTGSKSKIIFTDLPVDDPKMRRPDISLAKEKLGWAPVVGLEEGLKKVIDSYREKLSR